MIAHNSLGAQLRAIRLAKGITSYKLAKRTGLKRPNIVRAEKGGGLTLATLTKIAGALGYRLEIVKA